MIEGVNVFSVSKPSTMLLTFLTLYAIKIVNNQNKQQSKLKVKMTLYKYLQLQEVEPENASSELDYFEEDYISLYDQPAADDLIRSWDAILRQSQETEQ